MGSTVDGEDQHSGCDDSLLSVSTEHAEYLLHPGTHRRPTRVTDSTLRRIDGLVLESGMRQYGDLSLDDLRNHQQYAAILPDAMEQETDIFVVDAPYTGSDARIVLGEGGATLGVPCLAGLLGLAHGHPGLGLLTVPVLAFCAGGVLPRSPSPLISYAQLSNAYNSFGVRSAVAAMKLEEWAAPRLAEQTGGTPTILVDYGAGHMDIAAYLQHRLLRKAVVTYGERVLRGSLDTDQLRHSCRFRYDTATNGYEKIVTERSF